jgi:hypothetical protein
VGQFIFKYSLQSSETNSVIHDSPTLGVLLVAPTPALSLCYFCHLHSLRVQLFAPSLFSRTDSVFHPTPTVSVRLQFAVYAFQFCCVCRFNLPRGCAGLCSWVWVGELRVVHIAHLLGLQFYAGSFETGQQRKIVCCFSQDRQFLGLGSVRWGIGRLSMA